MAWLRRWILAVPLPVRWTVYVLYLGLVALLSLVPADVFPARATRLPGADKVVHFAMYGGLAVLLRWTLAGRPVTGRRYGWALGMALGYGVLMEAMQHFFTGGTRAFAVSDIVANTVGAVLCWFAAGWWLGPE